MAKVDVGYTDYLAETLESLADPGALLVTQGTDGRPNAMTIGWGTVGIIWGKPIFVVLVRQSRYTWSRLQQNGDFTVNLLPHDLAQAATVCGSKSGRDLDKFAATGLSAAPAQHVTAPIVEQCVVHYECRSLHKNNLDPTHLDPGVLENCYPQGDFHTLYYGHILGAQAAEEARQALTTPA